QVKIGFMRFPARVLFDLGGWISYPWPLAITFSIDLKLALFIACLFAHPSKLKVLHQFTRNTEMDTDQYFIAKDYLREFDLKELFVKHTVIFSELHFHEGDEPLSSKQRDVLTSQLQDVMNEMTLLVLRKKNSNAQYLNQTKSRKPGVLTSTVKPPIAHQADHLNRAYS
ncbi:MAG: hypothetical protein WCI39_12100, partial [Gallionellaceae bacterium]